MKKNDLQAIAFPCFGTRISPRFDYAQSILIVTVRGGEIVERQDLATGYSRPLEKIHELIRLGVKTIACGGIDRLSLHYCRKQHLRVYAWLTGEVEDILADMLRAGTSVSRPSSKKVCRPVGPKNKLKPCRASNT